MKKIHYKLPLVITLLLLGLSLPFLVQAESTELECSSNPDSPTDSFGNTPLHYAVVGGDLYVATSLIECGANLDYQDYFGWTALHLAAYFGHVDVAELLLDEGADPYTTADFFFNRKTPRDVAKSNVLQMFDERGIRDLFYVEKLFH